MPRKPRQTCETTQSYQTESSHSSSSDSSIVVHQERFLKRLDSILRLTSVANFKTRVTDLKAIFASDNDHDIFNVDGEAITLRRDIVLGELDQILESQTLERAKYYLKRLRTGVATTKTSKLNDINLARWKEYDNILTDSLWMMHKRDSSGAHLAEYWGNFIPQIPHQMMLRYTKKNDWVLDAFAGSGTTLIECRRLGRNGIGVELSANVAKRARELIEKQENPQNITTDIVVGDNRTVDYAAALRERGIDQVQLLLMHPPYHDIIKFSQDERDLSNAESTDAFLKMFGESVDNATPFLERGRYFAVVIGDKFSKGEWIPLGFYCMTKVLERGYMLKAIIVKNFEETRGKRNQKELWRYRALVGGFYVFKHEYVLLFRKK